MAIGDLTQAQGRDLVNGIVRAVEVANRKAEANQGHGGFDLLVFCAFDALEATNPAPLDGELDNTAVLFRSVMTADEATFKQRFFEQFDKDPAFKTFLQGVLDDYNALP